MKSQVLFHSTIILLFIAGFVALDRIDWFYDRGLNHIATVSEQEGKVQVRPEDLSLWRPISQQQKLFSKEIIATGDESTAALAFEDGRVLEIGPNSQVKIEGASSSQTQGESGFLVNLFTARSPEPQKKAIEITLVRGRISAKPVRASTKPTRKIEIKSGSKTLALTEKNTSIDILKNLKFPEPQIAVLSGEAALVDREGRRTSLNKLTAPEIPEAVPVKLIEPEPIVEKKPEPPKTLPPPPESQLPLLSWPNRNETLWTTASIQRDPSWDFAAKITLKQDSSRDPRWQNAVRLKKGRQTKIIPLGQKRTVVQLSSDDFKKFALKKSSSLWTEYTIELQTGVIATTPKKASRFSKTRYRFKVASLPEGRNLPVSLTLSNLKPKPSNKFSLVKAPSKVDQAVQILLPSTQDLAKFKSLISGANSYSLQPLARKPSGNGVWLAFGSEIKAGINAQKITRKELRLLLKTVEANIAFEGFSDSLVFAKGDLRKPAFRTIARKQKKIYLVHNSEMKDFNTGLIRKDPAAGDFILQNATAVFSSPVKLLDQQMRSH